MAGQTLGEVDVAVVGAGVVGLAIARALATSGREVVLIEAATAIGTGISSRSSEVIHAGLYAPPGSLKAALCRRGRDLLADYCRARSIAHRRCGKLVVAADAADIPRLEALAQNAAACGVDDLEWLDAAQARSMEPALAVQAALWSPSSGIVDSHGLMQALWADAGAGGAVLARGSRVVGGEAASQGWRLRLASGHELGAALVVNAAGLGAVALARALGTQPPPLHLARGHYFALTGPSPFSRLIYPLPVAGGLGVHLTLDLAGQARFGPDVEWLDETDPDRLDYRVDGARMARFEADIRRYWPGLPDGRLQPAYCGVRPKLSGPGEPPADFVIDTSAPGLIQLLGIESPGLTAALALAEQVAMRLPATGHRMDRA